MAICEIEKDILVKKKKREGGDFYPSWLYFRGALCRRLLKKIRGERRSLQGFRTPREL